MATIKPIIPIPKYGTQAPNAAQGQVNVFDPNTSAPLQGAGAFNPNTGAKIQNTPIDANIVGNTTPLNIPSVTPTIPPNPNPVPPPSGTTADTNGAAVIPPPEAQPSATVGIIDKLKELMGIQATKGDVTAQLQEQEQLAQKTQEATQTYNAYTQAKLEQAQTIEKMRIENPTGMLQGGHDARITEYTARSNANLANLAVQAQVSQGLLSAAEQTIKDKLDAQFTPINDQIDATYKLYSLVQNDMTESEKFQAQNAIDQKKTETASVQATANDIHKTLLDNGAPASVYGAIDKVTQDFLAGKINAQEAQNKMFSAAAGFGQNPQDVALKNAQIASANRANQPSGTTNGVAPVGSPANMQQQAQSASNIQLIDGLKIDKGLGGSVGANVFARSALDFDWITGVRKNFIAGVQQLTSQLTLDSLINAKARGATFGALSEGELNILAGSATKLNTWAIKDKNGNVSGYDTSEKNFKAELDKISNFAKLDYLLKGGDPAEVGVQVMPDGSLVTQNSDGTFTILR